MPKDREIIYALGEGVRIVYRRSSAYPIEYAILLQIHNGDGWETQISCDNAHEGERRDSSVDDHHFHRYSDGQKRSPQSLPFTVKGTNDAMHKAIRWLADKWEELIS